MGNITKCGSSKNTDDDKYPYSKPLLQTETIDDQYSNRNQTQQTHMESLQSIFKVHYDAIVGTLEAHQKLVDQLKELELPRDEGARDTSEKVSITEGEIKKIIQASCTQAVTFHETVMELYSIKDKLTSNNMKTFDIDTPQKIKNYLQTWKSQTLKETQEMSSSIQVFHSYSGNIIKEIEEGLTKALKLRLNDVTIIKRSQLCDIESSQKLIVLSFNSTRLESDATNAITDIRNPANTALVMIHIKEVHALPEQRSAHVLRDEKFKALGGIFDLAFASEKGVYICKMNEDAFDGICSFVKKEAVVMDTHLSEKDN